MCVAIFSRPVSRMLQAAGAVELVRVASDGTTQHAASKCVGQATRAALALGYRRLVSYTLLGEAGTIYRATGWRVCGTTLGGSWSRSGRERAEPEQAGGKARWETGPDAASLDPVADDLVRSLVGRVALQPRRAADLPLFPE